MNQDFLEKLRKKALYIKLESDIRFGGAIDVDSLTKVLSAIKTSYLNFFDAEMRNILQKKIKITKYVDQEIEKLKSETELLVVDLDFGSFEAGLCPNTITQLNMYSYVKEPLETKKEIFDHYKSNVFFADYSNPKKMEKSLENFTAEERIGIFKPLIGTISGKHRYKFYFGKSKEKIKSTFKTPSEKTLEKLIPEISDIKKQKRNELTVIYAETVEGYDLFGPRQKIKKVLATEKLEKPVYPYQFNSIKFDDRQIMLNELISAQVSFDENENLFYITYEDLDLQVWGEERKDAEEAFQFAFAMLVKNIYEESDENITDNAKKLKDKMNTLIKGIN